MTADVNVTEKAARAVVENTDEPMWSAVVIARAALSAANVPGLVAEVERLRYDLDHSYSQREWSALTARATSAEQERDRLRAGIEALVNDPTAQDETGTWLDRKRVADILAGSGEQPGEAERPKPCSTCGTPYDACTERIRSGKKACCGTCGYTATHEQDAWEAHERKRSKARSAPVVHNHGTEDGPGLSCREERLSDGSLRGECIAPVVPDGGHVLTEYGTTSCPVEIVRAEVVDGKCSACGAVVPDSPDVRERVRRAVKRAATWTEDGPEYEEAPDAGMVEKITDAVLAAVRPTGQEQADD